VDDLIDRQSREIDPKKRLVLVIQIQQRLEADVAKPILGWRFGYFVQWPYVKNLVPHHVITTTRACKRCGSTSSGDSRL
jgi:hypothetical protein